MGGTVAFRPGIGPDWHDTASILGPFLVGCLMWWASDHPSMVAKDGIARVFALLVYLAGYATIGIYYVVLLFAAMASWARRNDAMRKAAESTAVTPLVPESR